jgi:hypothetical protein
VKVSSGRCRTVRTSEAPEGGGEYWVSVVVVIRVVQKVRRLWGRRRIVGLARFRQVPVLCTLFPLQAQRLNALRYLIRLAKVSEPPQRISKAFLVFLSSSVCPYSYPRSLGLSFFSFSSTHSLVSSRYTILTHSSLSPTGQTVGRKESKKKKPRSPGDFTWHLALPRILTSDLSGGS